MGIEDGEEVMGASEANSEEHRGKRAMYYSYAMIIDYKNGKEKRLKRNTPNLPWLVWLSGLSASLRINRSPVRFPVRAHAWVAGQVTSGGA